MKARCGWASLACIALVSVLLGVWHRRHEPALAAGEDGGAAANLAAPEADDAAAVDEGVAEPAQPATDPLLPATFAEASPRLVAVVRERIGVETARIAVSPRPDQALEPEPPHVALTDDLWGVLAYKTGRRFRRLDAATLRNW